MLGAQNQFTVSFYTDLHENGVTAETCYKQNGGVQESAGQRTTHVRRQLGIKRCLVTLDHLQVLASSCTEAFMIMITIVLFLLGK